jgi:glycosyltransferase involved in cell wall biosynthesis
MAARLLWDKGIAEFVEAARMIKNQGIEGKFWVAGEPDPGNPACVPKDVLAKWKAEGPVEFLGHQGNMSQLLQMVDVAVLPSYHEGVPAFLLEAAASGLPLVASDIRGCQVVVDEGKNGILIPPGNATKLAQAITPLLLDPEKRFQMGKESRKIAKARFDQRMINQTYIGLYKELGVGLK